MKARVIGLTLAVAILSSIVFAVLVFSGFFSEKPETRALVLLSSGEHGSQKLNLSGHSHWSLELIKVPASESLGELKISLSLEGCAQADPSIMIAVDGTLAKPEVGKSIPIYEGNLNGLTTPPIILVASKNRKNLCLILNWNLEAAQSPSPLLKIEADHVPRSL